MEVILQILSNVSSPAYAQIATSIHLNLTHLLNSSKRYRLPSRAIGELWAKFHRLRLHPVILSSWEQFVKDASIKGDEVHLTLQLVIDRLLKQLINQQAKVTTQKSFTSNQLTVREQNAIRYMAGYIAIKLQKRYKCHSSNPTLQKKHKIFVAVLTKMTADNQPPGVETLDDYTRLWSELIDRGGLYHINDEVMPHCCSFHIGAAHSCN